MAGVFHFDSGWVHEIRGVRIVEEEANRGKYGARVNRLIFSETK